MNDEKKIEMSNEVLKKILDHSPNEIYVLDKDARIVYVNKACERHYGIKLENVVGKTNDELTTKDYWKPPILPLVFKEKKAVTIKQITYVGKELITTAIPLLNDKQEIELIITTGQEPHYKDIHISDEQEIEAADLTDAYKENVITNNEKMNNVIKINQLNTVAQTRENPMRDLIEKIAMIYVLQHILLILFLVVFLFCFFGRRNKLFKDIF